jgi:hypothetical protein
MSGYPIARSPQEARTADAPIARTADEAAERSGGPVFLAVEALPFAFDSIADAEREEPGIYGDTRYELVWRDGAWRVLVRFWRPAPPAPIARTAQAAAQSRLGTARTPEEAQAALGAPAELVVEPLPRLYRTISRARARFRDQLDQGLARLEERDGGYAVLLAFWRPIAGSVGLTPAERRELGDRAAAPLRPMQPQADPYVGLFERLAPENPAIVLAEEGDGRTRGE